MTAQTTINPQGPGTSFGGPVIVGPRSSGSVAFPQGGNQGIAELTQVVSLAQNGTTAVTVTALVPKHSQLVDFIVDTTIAWNSGTSAVLSIGTTAADTTYVNGLSVATGTRARPAYNTTQLTAMLDVGSVETVAFTVTPTGATSAGTTFVTMQYRMTQNYQNP